MIEKVPGIGDLLEEPKGITGGLLHKMYRVRTTKGVFAVKEMNPEIMKRPGVFENMVRSERIAARFGEELPVVSALEINGQQIHFIEGYFYMVFPWMEGSSVFPPDIKKYHCAIMGDLLGKIHELDIRLSAGEDSSEEVPLYKWEEYLQKAVRQDVSWAEEYRKNISDLQKQNQKACDAQRVLKREQVISHRDLDPKNVMWNGEGAHIIDWEAAGPVNPYQEFVECILYWADDGKDGLAKDLFDAFVRAYRKHKDLGRVDWESVSAGSCSGILGWLAYNIRRALGIEAADEEEIRLGEELIPRAIKEFENYQKKVSLIQKWIK